MDNHVSKVPSTCGTPVSHRAQKVNWLPVFLPPLIRFWLILNPHFLQLVSNSLIFDSYTTLFHHWDTLNQVITDKKILQSHFGNRHQKNSILHRSHNLDLVDLHSKIKNTCSFYTVSLNKKNTQYWSQYLREIDFSMKKEIDKKTHG